MAGWICSPRIKTGRSTVCSETTDRSSSTSRTSSAWPPTDGVQWIDFDGNGALDLSLANNNPNGGHYLFRNTLAPNRARRSIQVMVVDERGRYTRAGSEVRVYAPGTRNVLGGRLVDTGG